MGLFSSIRVLWAQLTTGQHSGPQDNSPIGGSSSKDSPSVGQDAAMTVSAVWASMKLLCETLASLPFFVYDNTDPKNRKLVRDTSLYILLHETPNRRHTPMEFWAVMWMNFFFRGNAYALMQRGYNNEVIQLWPLAADQVEVEVAKNGDLIYKYYYDGNINIYSAESILHLRDTGNGVLGMNRLDYMRQSLGIAIGANSQLARTFSRDAKRPGVFSIDKTLTADQRAQIRKEFKGLSEGNDDNLFVLEHGAKFDPLSLTPAEMQLMETREMSAEEMARWFGVPSVLVNDGNNTTKWGSGIGEIIEGFYKFQLRTIIVNMQQAVRKRVMTPQQRSKFIAEVNIDAILAASKKDRVEIYAKEVQNGLKTRNEVRALENDPPITGGDVLTVQSNLVPIDMLGKVQNQGATNDQSTKDPISQ